VTTGSRLIVLLAAAALAVSACGHDASPPAGNSPQPAAGGSSVPATPGDGSPPAGSLTTPPGGPAPALPRGGPVPADFRAWSVTWASGQVGYVLGSGRCSRPPCTSVVRTTDGGRHWIGVPAPVAPLPARSEPDRSVAADTVQDVRFATPTDGYAFGGALWTTHDGARTWRKLTVGAVYDLATDGRTAYAVVATCAGGRPPCDRLQLLTSAVGRDDFRPVGVSTAEAAGRGSVSTGSGPAVAVLGSAIFVAASAGQWNRIPSPCPSLVGVLSAASGGALVAFCGEGAAGSLYVTARRSTDGGRGWGAASAAARVPNGLVTVTAGSTAVLAVASTNPDLGGALLVSRDGGARWAATAVPRGSHGYRYVGARSASSLVALASPPTGAIWTTSTAGRTWASLPIR
jgi:hypothetical protein